MMPKSSAPNPGSELSLHQQMRDRIVSLSFPAFCQIIRRMLHHSGYSSIQSLGTGTKRKTTGRGGSDLLALAHTDLATALTAIQIKQYRQAVPRRFIDELRGTMLRLGAEQGLLIVTSRFSETARNVAEQSQILPIQLIDGQKLVESLVAYRIGLKEAKDEGRSEWVFDHDYFDELERQAQSWLREARTHPNVGLGHLDNPKGRRQQ